MILIEIQTPKKINQDCRMKNIKKVCTIIGLGTALSASSLHADFDGVRNASPTPLPASDYTPNPTPKFAVPEPTTILAGALLLLPFGVSMVRILRRNRAQKPQNLHCF